MGLWHTKCFPKSSQPTQSELEELCKELGVKNENSTATARLMTSTNVTEEGKTLPVEFSDGQNATKVVLYSKFSPTKISEDFTVHMKTGKPLAKVVKWEKNDHENCYRMDIKC